jgi:hypothetical protein
MGFRVADASGVAQHAAKLLDRLHLFETGPERLGGDTYGIGCRMTCLFRGRSSVFAGNPGRFARLAQPFAIFPHGIERLAMLIADFPRLFSEVPEALGLRPGRFCLGSSFFAAVGALG